MGPALESATGNWLVILEWSGEADGVLGSPAKGIRGLGCSYGIFISVAERRNSGKYDVRDGMMKQRVGDGQ